MKLKYLLIAIVAVLALWFIYDSFSQPGPQNLEGDFKEVAFYRNENNTGPIVRIYAATVADTLWTKMKQYGDFMPHTKYGNTKVYFFLSNGPSPEKVSADDQHISAQYQESCIAKYEKDAMGMVTFIKFPFRR
ncbi:hypothetical protein H8S95_07340 [Pontibacter sp. KCTC 32443]|uniref:hypothetical protein n=1 Tax=Pontibacter TaxID=323449 RepID=UPI00164DBF3E|nr:MULTISPECIES: hypothetical protein [Pontibacter]MBC5773872.1 hypothetical protein [Pontibacter sp. KCTC 32443]